MIFSLLENTVVVLGKRLVEAFYNIMHMQLYCCSSSFDSRVISEVGGTVFILIQYFPCFLKIIKMIFSDNVNLGINQKILQDLEYSWQIFFWGCCVSPNLPPPPSHPTQMPSQNIQEPIHPLLSPLLWPQKFSTGIN